MALYLPAVTNESVPLIGMGCLILVGGLLTVLLLPEPFGMPLAETIEDIEKMPTLFSRRKPLGSNTAMVEANNFISQTQSLSREPS